MISSVSLIEKYWKYSGAEVERSLSCIWFNLFNGSLSLTPQLISTIYSILARNELSMLSELIAIEILLFHNRIPDLFVYNFSGRFSAYRQAQSWTCFQILFRAYSANPSLAMDNIAEVVGTLSLPSSDAPRFGPNVISISLAAISHFMRYRSSSILNLNILSAQSLAEQYFLGNGGSCDSHDHVRSSQNTYNLLGAARDIFTSSTSFLTVGEPAAESIIRLELGQGFTDDLMPDLFGLPPVQRQAALIDNVIIAGQMSRCDYINQNIRSLELSMGIMSKMSDSAFIYAADLALELGVSFNNIDSDKLIHIVINNYADPLLAFSIMRFIDHHVVKLISIGWLSEWLPGIMKIVACFPISYAVYIQRWLTLSVLDITTLVTAIFNLPLISSTIEFSQIIEVDLNLKHAFLTAVRNDPDLFRVYTSLLSNNDESQCAHFIPLKLLNDKSELWRQITFRVSQVCSILPSCLGALFKSALGRGELKAIATVMMDRYESWSILSVHGDICHFLSIIFQAEPDLIIQLCPIILSILSDHRLPVLSQLVSALISNIGQHCVGCDPHDQVLCMYIECIEAIAIETIGACQICRVDDVQAWIHQLHDQPILYSAITTLINLSIISSHQPMSALRHIFHHHGSELGEGISKGVVRKMGLGTRKLESGNEAVRDDIGDEQEDGSGHIDYWNELP
uniref:Uncharacterized protein n=1 Tax=Spongospora subterranea TaxID=70186 RepID=A0A0H5RPH9_9EUKA|eukprot:CRZ10629.1 hypothetical protein [Spongospora subterranea]